MVQDRKLFEIYMHFALILIEINFWILFLIKINIQIIENLIFFQSLTKPTFSFRPKSSSIKSGEDLHVACSPKTHHMIKIASTVSNLQKARIPPFSQLVFMRSINQIFAFLPMLYLFIFCFFPLANFRMSWSFLRNLILRLLYSTSLGWTGVPTSQPHR